MQLRSSKRRVDARQRAAEYLKRRAGALSSRTLAALASVVASNPFAKVIEMINELIGKLKQEAAAEADHKAWCDGELKGNKLKREEKTTAVSTLSAEVQELSGNVETMGETIETLAKEQSALAKAMGEATAQREKEKATNTDTIADAAAGAAAVKQAIAILEEFYASQAAFLQRQGRQVPEMQAYKGMQGENKGVVGLLQVIESDFMRLEADTKAAEEQAAKEYDTFMKDSAADKLQKHNAEVKLRLEKDATEFDRSQTQKDLVAEEDALKKANMYYEELKPSCVEIHVSFEERAARRKEEIEALKEAYAILDTKSG